MNKCIRHAHGRETVTECTVKFTPPRTMNIQRNIRIWHECEVRTDKSVPRASVLGSRGSAE